MSAILKANLVAENIKPKIGSRILNGKQELLGGELGSDLRKLLEMRGVLLSPGSVSPMPNRSLSRGP